MEFGLDVAQPMEASRPRGRPRVPGLRGVGRLTNSTRLPQTYVVYSTTKNNRKSQFWLWGKFTLDSVSGERFHEDYEDAVVLQRDLISAPSHIIVVWRVSQATALLVLVEVLGSASRSWTPVCRLNTHDADVIRICQSLRLPPTVRAFRVRHTLAEACVGGQVKSLVTTRVVCHFAGVQLAMMLTPRPPTATLLPLDAPVDTRRADEDLEDDAVARRVSNVDMYDVPVILGAWKLKQLLKPKTPLDRVVRLVCDMAPPEAAARIRRGLSDGSLRLPAETTLLGCSHRLNLLYSVWQRKLHKQFEYDRYVMADSSPQLGFNIYGIVEDRVSWPKGASLADRVELDLQAWCELNRHYLATTLGYGAAGQVHKTINTVHCILVETGSAAFYDKHRFEVRAWTSDQGVERMVVDSGNPLTVDANLAETVDRVRAGLVSSNSTAAATAWLFPRAIFMPDHLHMIFNLVGEALEHVPEWPELSSCFHAIASFLHDKGLRGRYQASCLSGADQHIQFAMFNDWGGGSKGVLEKWQYFSKLLSDFIPRVKIMASTFDPGKSRTSKACQRRRVRVCVCVCVCVCGCGCA